jgi:glucose/arabinose dehydrogenase
MLLRDLIVRTVATDLDTPTSLAILNNNELLVTEKNTGRVQHLVNGEVNSTVLDLPVNFASERGLLSIALDPNFARTRFVYLYWTSLLSAPAGPTQTSTVDSDDVLDVPLLGNRVDRFRWDTSGDTPQLRFDRNLLQLRAFQNDGVAEPPGQGDAGQPPLGNHDGGVIRFGRDGKLYVIIGDVGRRSALQNLEFGPKADQAAPAVPDDQFGGPTPDDAHFTGVILRINRDGSTPGDNPFFRIGAQIGGEVGANIQQVFAYGIRNSFGMTVDPFTGRLWYSENGDDSFDEINQAFPGHNSGWVQTMGPLSRIDEFKQIETTFGNGTIQQLRYPPANIADTEREARLRLFDLPGSRYSDPEFSWKFAVPPTALAFVSDSDLGRHLRGDLLVGNGAGQIMAFDLARNRTDFNLNGGLRDLVDDNTTKFVPAESQRLVIGEGFGIITDLQSSRNGMYVLSHTNGALYEVTQRGTRTFNTPLTGRQEVPARTTRASGSTIVNFSPDGQRLSFLTLVRNITNVTAVHLHLGPAGANGPIVASLFEAEPGGGRASSLLARGTLTAADLVGPLAGRSLDDLYAEILAGNIYLDVHTDNALPGDNTGPGDFTDGEIRGQLRPNRFFT